MEEMNMIKNMKSYDEASGSIQKVVSLRLDSEYINEIIPLFTFPEYEDGEPQFWSGDLFWSQRDADNKTPFLCFMYHDGYKWNYKTAHNMNDISIAYYLKAEQRICSVFSKEAVELTNLTLNEIEDLKQFLKD
jgi:hypothetical protein